ncbi:retrovirus-related pol polyprotein from transposon TNT 1-94 [Tanacetum coccineum]
MNSVINCETEKSTWDDLILYHEGPSDVKESRVMDLKLCYSTFKFKECETLTQTFTRYKALMNELVNDGINLSKLEINTGFINGLPKKWLSFFQSLRNTNHVKDSELASLFELRPTKDFEAKYNKVKAKLALLSLNASASKSLMVKNKGLVAEAYEWDEEEVARNGEWVKIAIRKVHTLLDMGNNDERKSFLDYLSTEYESTDESSVCSNSLPLLEKLAGAEPVSGPKTIKSILKSNSTSKKEVLKGVTLKEPHSAFAKSKASASKANSNLAGKLKGIKTEDDPPLANNDIRKPIWYLNSRCSMHMTGVKNYLHKYVEQPGPKVVFGDDLTCITEGYSSIKCNGIVFTKVTFVNGLKYNLVSIRQLCDAKYIVQLDEKIGTIFNSNKEVVMIAPRVRDVYVLDMTSYAQESCFFTKAFENLNWLWHKRLSHLNFKTINQLKSKALETIMSFIKRVENKNDIKVKQFRTDNGTEFRNSILINFCDERGISQNFSSPYTPEQNGVAERKNRTLIEAARTMLSGSVFLKQYWDEAVATTCYTQNRSTIVKRHLKTPYEIFRGRIPNIDFLHVFGCPVYIHNHKDYLGKFDEKANDGYFLRYLLVSKAFRVFNTKRQQTKVTYHITFNEITDAIKFTRSTYDYLIFPNSERYTPDDLEPNTNKSSDQTEQNDHPVQNDKILNDDQSEHSIHDNDNNIIENLTTNEIGQNSESSPSAEDASGNPGFGMLTRAIAKELGTASAHKFLFVDFLSEEEPKKASKALKHPGWVDAIQEELN